MCRGSPATFSGLLTEWGRKLKSEVERIEHRKKKAHRSEG
ncbi:hypothetical protein Vi05172_g151 [Venturia inaequalis]|nr:hypothetical protein Vi05172_g151 [Venturia inaequalis]